jgi:hypothetical protein
MGRFYLLIWIMGYILRGNGRLSLFLHLRFILFVPFAPSQTSAAPDTNTYLAETAVPNCSPADSTACHMGTSVADIRPIIPTGAVNGKKLNWIFEIHLMV